ncbi:hypothetical protein QYM36_014174, partial [Artemia franciscana]
MATWHKDRTKFATEAERNPRPTGKGECTIHLKPGAVPTVHPVRRKPFALHDKLESELEQLEKTGNYTKGHNSNGVELGKQATFQWTDVHKSEMEKIKVSICHNLEAFDAQSKEVELKTDSSKHGLGVELLTHGKIVAFATKALNEMKQCYSQAPSRLQRMIYQIQAYDLEVYNIIGKDILVADALSSLHPSEENDEFQNEIEFHVNSFVKHILNFREELAVVNGIILKADQIVIAPTIQPNILQHLHVPHMGMEKTKWKAQTVMNSVVVPDENQLIAPDPLLEDTESPKKPYATRPPITTPIRFRVDKTSDVAATLFATLNPAPFKAIETEAAESVASCLSKEREKEILENRQYVKALLKTTALLGRQGLAFRGHDEGESSANQGNFVETVHLLTEINPDLMKNSRKAYGHYMSHEYQNDYIE